MRKKSFISVLTLIFLFVAAMSISSEKPTKPSTDEMPENIKAIIDKSCFGCHNTNSKNEDAKEELDFKKLDDLTTMKKIGAYKHIGEVVEEAEMPPEKFLQKYPDKSLTDDEKKTLVAWAKKEAEALVKNK